MSPVLTCAVCGSDELRLLKWYTDDARIIRTLRCVNGHETTFTAPLVAEPESQSLEAQP